MQRRAFCCTQGNIAKPLLAGRESYLSGRIRRPRATPVCSLRSARPDLLLGGRVNGTRPPLSSSKERRGQTRSRKRSSQLASALTPLGRFGGLPNIEKHSNFSKVHSQRSKVCPTH